MSQVIGKVKYEDLNTIWNVYFPSPEDIEALCSNFVRKVVSERYFMELEEFNKMSFIKKFFSCVDRPDFTFSEKYILGDVNGMKSFFKKSTYAHKEDFDYYKDMFLAAQNVRKVLKLKRMAPLCMNNIYADESSLHALRDVIDNLDFYENLLVNYKLDFQD